MIFLYASTVCTACTSPWQTDCVKLQWAKHSQPEEGPPDFVRIRVRSRSRDGEILLTKQYGHSQVKDASVRGFSPLLQVGLEVSQVLTVWKDFRRKREK